MPRRKGFLTYWLLFDEEKGMMHVFRHKENAKRVGAEEGWVWIGETNQSEYVSPPGWSLDRMAGEA